MTFIKHATVEPLNGSWPCFDHGSAWLVQFFHFLKDIFGKFDGYLSPSQNLKFADVPSGLAAISKVPLEGWLQVLLVAGLIETQLFKDGNNDGRWWQSDI